MCRNQRGKSINIHDIFLPGDQNPRSPKETRKKYKERKYVQTHAYRRKLVGAPQNKLQLVNRHIDCFQQRRNAVSVVFGAVLDQFNRGLEIIQEPVDIGEEDLNMAACLEELGDFHSLNGQLNRNEIGCLNTMGINQLTGTKYPQ